MNMAMIFTTAVPRSGSSRRPGRRSGASAPDGHGQQHRDGDDPRRTYGSRRWVLCMQLDSVQHRHAAVHT